MTNPTASPQQTYQRKPANHMDSRIKCGSCKWFHVGYSGMTCVRTRGVQGEDQACLEFENYKPSPFDVLMKDKYLRGIVSKAKAYTDEHLKRKLEEMKQFRIFKADHRESAAFDYASEEKLASLAKTFETISSYQEKILDIQDELRESLDVLQSQMKDVQAYLLSHYQEMFKNMKNEAERSAMLRVAVPEIFTAIDKTEGVYSRATSTYNYLKDLHFSTTATQSSAHKIWEYRVMFMAGRNRQNG